jgi:hypothetical protein
MSATSEKATFPDLDRDQPDTFHSARNHNENGE